jgi:hypothetical protein
VLGPDHPTTLYAAAALTAALIGLGAVEPARTLAEDTLQRSLMTLGEIPQCCSAKFPTSGLRGMLGR